MNRESSALPQGTDHAHQSGAGDTDPLAVVDAMFQRLLEAGVPLMRANIVLSTLHPEIAGLSLRWSRESGETVRIEGSRQRVQKEGLFDRSPYKLIFHDRYWGIRRRIERPGELRDLGVLDDLAEAGATDYVAMAASAGAIAGVAGTWATDRAGGFTTPELVLIGRELAATAPVLETLNLRILTAHLLDTYVGPRAGSRILTGEISRGSGETLEAVIWMVDMRGYTGLSDRLPRDRLISVLNAYYDRVVTPVLDHGGEVIKFIGDGVLAIFPTDRAGGAEAAAQAAVHAAGEALAAITTLNAERDPDLPEIGIGIVLHLGDISFGNVGHSRRLDFTVIGPAVNLASRMERLCSELGEAVLLSEDFAALVPDRCATVGSHRLRGLSRPLEVFRLR